MNFVKKNIIVLSLIAICAVSLFFQLYRNNVSPPCLNDDEAAFGYNAYSIMQTGKDEHGKFLPLRLESYGDFKLPLYAYFSIPFIKIFGTTELGIRTLNTLLSLLIIPLLYLVTKELTNNKYISLLSAFFLASSTWFHLLARNAHEGILCSTFILLSIYCILQYGKQFTYKYFLLANIFVLLATFTYHFGRIYLIFLFAWQLYILIFNTRKNAKTTIFILIGITLVFFSIPFITDAVYGANRVKFLFFMNNPGFPLRLIEYINEHPFRLLHNKLFEAVRTFSYKYFMQFSPNFMFFGDQNYRYTYENIGLVTVVEYVGLFIGLYFLFLKKNVYRFFILSLFLVSAVPNAVTFQDYSLVRNFFMIMPLSILSAYGVIYFIQQYNNKIIKTMIIVGIGSLYTFYLINNWDIYLFHYPKRAIVVRAWQCGRKEMSEYIKQNYNNFDSFVISNKDGQNYMFTLFYTGYDPQKYLNQHAEYKEYDSGFTTVEKFDKFNFVFKFDETARKTAFIGYPDEFDKGKIGNRPIKKIIYNGEELYWIVENR